jgi:hypothetical protein
MLLNFVLRDPASNPLLLIRDSELLISTGLSDFTMIGPNLHLQPAHSFKPLRLCFQENGMQITSGYFFGRSQAIDVSKDAITSFPGANRMSGARSSSRYGFVLR